MNPLALAQQINQIWDMRLDDRETAILARQLEFFEQRTFDVQYPEYQARRFLPVDNSVPNGANAITYRQWDGVGMAKIVANYADDIPLVDAFAKEFTTPVKSIADGYQYSIQDLRAAAQSGQPIDQERRTVAARVFEEAVDDIAANGIPEAGMPGFLNHPNVAVVSPTTGTWATATVEQILADLNKLVNSIVVSTKRVFVPNTVILDTASFALLASRPTGLNLDKTVLRVFLDTNPYITNIDQWFRLDTANAAGTGARIVAYKRAPDVVELKIPQEFEQFPPQARNLAFVVPCHGRIGGTVIRYPLAIAYMDGI